jgi:uncharacterized protein
MPVPPRIGLVTLGTADHERMRTFYMALGWPVAMDVPDDICVFRTAGAQLILWPRPKLLEEVGRRPVAGDGFRHVAMAINVASPEEVDEALGAAVLAGGSLLRAARRMAWGGYSGYFGDPEGNAWEVAHNPYWPLDERGLPQLPAQ